MLSLYIKVPTSYLSHKPKGISHEEAASIPIGMLTTMRALREIGELKNRQALRPSGVNVFGAPCGTPHGRGETG